MANLRPKINFCNFSMSGTGLSTYIHRAMVSNSSKLNIVQNLFFICEGNDFSSFLLKNPNAEEEAVQSSDRTQSLLFDFFKSSYSLNFIYREIIKNYFLRKKIDPIQSASNAKTELANSSVSKNVYDRIPKDIMAKFEANLLNVSWFRVAMSNPDYFKDIHSPTEEGFKKQKNQLNKYISSLSTICGEESERCNHFILPHNYFILEESRKSWVRDFGFNYNNIEGKTKITNEMLINYNNVHYPNDLFQMEDYIPQDDHFLGSGTKKIAKFVFEKLGY